MPNNPTSKLKRIVVLGVAIAGIFFLNKILIGNRSELRSGFAIQPLSRGFSLVESGVQYEFYKDKLKAYPDPSHFKDFKHEGNDLEFNGECSDLYYTILIYGKDIDYRTDPASAKFNQAFECPKNPEGVAPQPYGAGKKFNFTVDQNTGLSEGKYYIIIADQGKDGTWYNPR